MRRSFDKAKGVAPLHVFSAWAKESQLILGQIKVEVGSNEIPATSQLLTLLDLKGCIVTIDAIGYQREIANKIVSSGDDYVLALKANQPSTHEEVLLTFAGADADTLTARLGAPVVTTDGDHGRIEQRRYWLADNIDWLSQKDQWLGLRGIGIAERVSEQGGKTTTDRRFFLVSFADDSEGFAAAVRGHWSIESALHWRLDVTFREDGSRIRKGHAAENFAMLRRAAISLLAHAPGKKISTAKKRYRAALDQDYLAKILRGAAAKTAMAAPIS